ncbi:Hypothetical predicted protein [Olea europaea subsp. europaea]|uniref:Uncharacterized protein n=1 Tax=Olea europaea subsp. europaea TaxID=158383 RepID=A0A8S0UV95_OLEEU|nr:Hypothetical predicted protein [Olea europaea subsp. europaea]
MIGVGVIDCLVLVDAMECISDRNYGHIMWFFQIHGNHNVVLLQSSLKALVATECLGLSSRSSGYVAIVCDDVREALSGTMWIHKEKTMHDEASMLYVVEFDFEWTGRGDAYDKVSLLYLVEFKFELMRRGDACRDWIMIQMYGHDRHAHESNCASVTSLPIKWLRVWRCRFLLSILKDLRPERFAFDFFDPFSLSLSSSGPCICMRVAIVKAIYELSPEKRFFKTVIRRRSLFVTHLLMSTKEQHDRKEYVKPDMFFMRRLAEKKKKKPLGTGSSTYNNQRDELARLSKLNPPSSTIKKGERKGKDKVEPSAGDRKRRVVISRNEGPPPPSKCQITIDESLKKPIEAEPIFALKIVELEEVAEEEGGLLSSCSSITEGKASSFLGNRSDEIPSEVSEMLPTEVQSATRLWYKYWMEKYSNYAEIYDAVDIIEAGLAMHARSQGFFVNAQIDMMRHQKANRKFERMAFDAVADAQK